MDLEESLDKINEVKLHKGLVSVSPVVIPSLDILKDIHEPLMSLVLTQRSFYSHIDLLDEWGKSQAPNAEDYGTNAEEWLKHEIRTHKGFWSLVGGAGLTVGGGVSGILPLTLIGTAGMLYGGITVHHSRYKTDTLQFEEDASNYIRDLAKFYAIGQTFTRKGLDVLGDSTNNYKESLDRFRWVLRKQGYHKEDIGILNAESSKIGDFANLYQDIIEQISSSKKGPVPKWGGGIAPHCIGEMGSIDINSIESMFEDYKNLTDLVVNYIKGPRLVVLK
jgi:hypothetical protein